MRLLPITIVAKLIQFAIELDCVIATSMVGDRGYLRRSPSERGMRQDLRLVGNPICSVGNPICSVGNPICSVGDPICSVGNPICPAGNPNGDAVHFSQPVRGKHCPDPAALNRSAGRDHSLTWT